MSPVITFGGLLGEATEGRIVCVKSEILNQTYIPRFVVSIFLVLHESPLSIGVSVFRRLQTKLLPPVGKFMDTSLCIVSRVQ